MIQLHCHSSYPSGTRKALVPSVGGLAKAKVSSYVIPAFLNRSHFHSSTALCGRFKLALLLLSPQPYSRTVNPPAPLGFPHTENARSSPHLPPCLGVIRNAIALRLCRKPLPFPSSSLRMAQRRAGCMRVRVSGHRAMTAKDRP